MTPYYGSWYDTAGKRNKKSCSIIPLWETQRKQVLDQWAKFGKKYEYNTGIALAQLPYDVYSIDASKVIWW